MYCKHCGSQIADDSRFCNSCGGDQGSNSVQPAQQPQTVQVIYQVPNQLQNQARYTPCIDGKEGREKDRMIAFFLCLFLGEFGAHRFYEGKILTGLLWMFTLGLAGVGWLVDLIIIIRKPSIYYV